MALIGQKLGKQTKKKVADAAATVFLSGVSTEVAM